MWDFGDPWGVLPPKGETVSGAGRYVPSSKISRRSVSPSPIEIPVTEQIHRITLTQCFIQAHLGGGDYPQTSNPPKNLRRGLLLCQ